MLEKSKGLEFERSFSLSYLDSSALALLVSPLVLRERGLGQIDFALFKPQNELREAQAIIIECKYSSRPTGLAPKQWTRLKNSARFLGELLDCGVELKIESKKKRSERSN